jgi:hypothetical protein
MMAANQDARIAFPGSYAPGDVNFLLQTVHIEDTPVAVKESLIQSGQRHYSQMLSLEALPPPEYVTLFQQALTENKARVAEDVMELARRILAARPHGITLVSLARAGTPIGVLLKRVLQQHLNTDAAHYSVSIIRDIGLDLNALRYILRHHEARTLVFVDGWTGKGVIARQLADSLAVFAQSDGIAIAPDLHVLADLAGVAAVAATADDYLIPSCILNATVSGLVSRTVFDSSLIGANAFHGCVFYEQFLNDDLSNFFINEIMEAMRPDEAGEGSVELDKPGLQAKARNLLATISDRYQVSRPHYIKPGIGEATRVLLRREARLLVLQDLASEATRHLRWLAEAKAVPIAVDDKLPYRAVALIKEMLND